MINKTDSLAILNKENYPESSATHFSYISCTVSFTPVPTFASLFHLLFPALAPLLPLLFLSIIFCYLSYSCKCFPLYSAVAPLISLSNRELAHCFFPILTLSLFPIPALVHWSFPILTLSFSISYTRTFALILFLHLLYFLFQNLSTDPFLFLHFLLSFLYQNFSTDPILFLHLLYFLFQNLSTDPFLFLHFLSFSLSLFPIPEHVYWSFPILTLSLFLSFLFQNLSTDPFLFLHFLSLFLIPELLHWSYSYTFSISYSRTCPLILSYSYPYSRSLYSRTGPLILPIPTLSLFLQNFSINPSITLSLFSIPELVNWSFPTLFSTNLLWWSLSSFCVWLTDPLIFFDLLQWNLSFSCIGSTDPFPIPVLAQLINFLFLHNGSTNSFLFLYLSSELSSYFSS